ncbi:MAG TPA: PKD domain-containing protein [Solirubrobacterales bacterium]|nr:PKD domain-containing protein [Solirubrobacterales bacterium]
MLAAIIGVLATAAPSASAADWLPAVDASPVLSNASQFSGSLQDVAIDAQGNATAVWVQWAGLGDAKILEAATRPAGGSWSAPVQLSEAGEQALSPKVVVDANGDAAVIWEAFTGSNNEIVRAATRPADGAWSQAVALSDVDGYSGSPDITIDPQGNATAVWTTGPQFEYGFVQTATHPAGGTWSQPVALSDENAASVSPHIAADSQGDLTAIWDAGGEEGVIQSKTRPAGGEWSSAAVDVSGEDGLSSNAQIAIDGQGDAVAVWQQKDAPVASGFHYFVQTARRVSGSWSSPLTISREDGLAINPGLAVDPDGNATVAWAWIPLAAATATGLQARTGTAGGTWGSIVYVATRPSGSGSSEGAIQLLADQQGDVTVIWLGWSAPNDVVRSARRPAAGEWSSPVTLSTGESLIPASAINPQGTITAVWSGRQGTTQAVRSRVFDPIPPELNDVAVPATGVVGQPVSMSVDPFDVWSPVATSWNFGDGSSDESGSVSHCYGTAGERTVTITGTDAAANMTSTSRTITIEPNPGLAGDPNPCAEPEPPALTGTDPPSPASSGTPRILGAAEAGSVVKVYAGANCAGSPVATGSAAELGAPGIAVQVDEEVTAVFSATATDASDATSGCSGPISYTRLKAPEDSGDGGGPTIDGGGSELAPASVCIVPKLAGKTLAQAKAKLRAAACRVGTVRRPRPRRGRRLPPLVVKSSNPAAGAKPASGKVNLTLEPRPRKRNGHS